MSQYAELERDAYQRGDVVLADLYAALDDAEEHQGEEIKALEAELGAERVELKEAQERIERLEEELSELTDKLHDAEEDISAWEAAESDKSKRSTAKRQPKQPRRLVQLARDLRKAA